MKAKKKLDHANQKSWFLFTLDRLVDENPDSALWIHVADATTQTVKTRRELRQYITNVAAFLSSLGVSHETRIIFDIDVRIGWEVWVAWCACQWLGACAVFFPPDMRYRDVKKEIDDADAYNGAPAMAFVGTPERVKKWVTTEAEASVARRLIYFTPICRDGADIATLFDGSLPQNLIDFEKCVQFQPETPTIPVFVAADAPAALSFTQGSHQNARRIELSYGHFMAQAEDLQQLLKLSSGDRLTIDLTSPIAVCLFIFSATLYSGAVFVSRSAALSVDEVLVCAGITHAFMLPYSLERLVQGIQNPELTSRVKTRWRHLCLSGGKFRVRNTRSYLKWTEKLIHSFCTAPIKASQMPGLKAFISYGNHFNAKHGELLSFVDVPVFNAFTVSELGFVHLHAFMGKGGYLKSVETKVRNGVLSVKSRRSSAYICTDDLVFEDARCGLCSRRNIVLKLTDDVVIDASPIREILRRHDMIDEVFVFGHGRPFLTALIYLNAEVLKAWCMSQKLPADDFADMAQHPQVYSHIKSLVDACNQKRRAHEAIQKFSVIHRPIALDPRILTPCYLTRPTDVERRYAALLQSLYIDNY